MPTQAEKLLDSFVGLIEFLSYVAEESLYTTANSLIFGVDDTPECVRITGIHL